MSLHIPCEKCVHAVYWRRWKEPLDGIEWRYYWDVECAKNLSPGEACSAYKGKSLKQRLKERFG